MVMDVLSRITSQTEKEGGIHGIGIARPAPPISHLLFADNLMFFCRANSKEATKARHIMSTFESWSGQTINLAKSFLHFSRNVGRETKVHLGSILRLQQARDAGSYLGLPLSLNRSKTLAFNEVTEKVQKRVAGRHILYLKQVEQC